MSTTTNRACPFWRSRAGLTLWAFLLAAGFFLLLEHRTHVLGFLAQYAILLPLLICIGMHFFMHRHGGHGSHGGRNQGGSDREDDHAS
jgi:hypothetical protein